MTDVNTFSPGFLNHTFKEELEEGYDDFEDDIVIKYEPKYAEVMQESLIENDYLTSNTNETESLENLSTNKGSEISGNMILPLIIKSEEEDCVLDKITLPNHCVVNSAKRLQENVTESLASGSGFLRAQNVIVQKSDGTSCQYTLLFNGDKNSESNIDASNKKDQNYFEASNEIDSNTKIIDVCNESILMKNRSNFSCPQCSYVTKCKSNLKLHIKSHINFKNSSCDGCNFRSTPVALRHHQYKCESSVLKNALPQCQENKNNKNPPRFSCPKCSYVTKCTSNLEPHIKSHINFKNSSCDGCNFKSTPIALRHHQYKCASFLLKNPLPQRQENKNNKNPPRFSCPKCSYATKCKSNLEPHINSHINFKNSSCDGCNFKSTPIALMHHQYKCESSLLKNPLPQCQENKNDRTLLRFSCPECSHVTTRTKDLESHIKSHINFKNSSCDGCNFKSTPIALRYHQYKCESFLLKNLLPERPKKEKQ